MAKAKAKKKELSLEDAFWNCCVALRGVGSLKKNRDSVISLVFLKFAGNKFKARRRELPSVLKEQYGLDEFPPQMLEDPITSQNGDKISIALNEDDCSYITSAINTVFKVRDEAKDTLLPGYLMLFFNRPEFDRYARFNSQGSARETFNRDEMCHVRIPISDIATQQYVMAFNRSWRTRQRVNEQLKERLKSICPILVKGSIEEARR